MILPSEGFNGGKKHSRLDVQEISFFAWQVPIKFSCSQGFKSMLLIKSTNKFFKHHCATMVKYNATLQELRLTVHV